MQDSTVRKILNNNNLIKWGFAYPSQSDIVKDKLRNTVGNNTHNKYVDMIPPDYEIISFDNTEFNILHKTCNSVFCVKRTFLYDRLYHDIIPCTHCKPVDMLMSSQEIEVQQFLSSYNVNFISSDRTILAGKELDIYIPSHNLAIEINGVYWHNELYKDSDYHINKTLECNKLGIQLLHVWEDDWRHKKDIIKSIILNRLGLITNKIYARKCIIKDVDSSDAKLFLDENHIQGFAPSQIKIGLYHNEELVSLMTFGDRYTNGKKEFELIRFCNKINYLVIGAASKLFNSLTKDVDIITYADISLFEGTLYEKLGFRKESLSKPNYFWVVDSIRRHRFNFNKKKLIEEGFDANKTEVEIMHERGYYRTWGCGQEKWIYRS